MWVLVKFQICNFKNQYKQIYRTGRSPAYKIRTKLAPTKSNVPHHSPPYRHRNSSCVWLAPLNVSQSCRSIVGRELLQPIGIQMKRWLEPPTLPWTRLNEASAIKTESSCCRPSLSAFVRRPGCSSFHPPRNKTTKTAMSEKLPYKVGQWQHLIYVSFFIYLLCLERCICFSVQAYL